MYGYTSPGCVVRWNGLVVCRERARRERSNGTLGSSQLSKAVRPRGFPFASSLHRPCCQPLLEHVSLSVKKANAWSGQRARSVASASPGVSRAFPEWTAAGRRTRGKCYDPTVRRELLVGRTPRPAAVAPVTRGDRPLEGYWLCARLRSRTRRGSRRPSRSHPPRQPRLR